MNRSSRRWSPSRGLARAAIYLIDIYRNMISPFRPPACRFTPTCSQYAVDALREHGFARGAWLAVVRLAKCGPWHRGGWDPIPEPRHHHHADAAATLRSDSLV
ncbi:MULTISPECIES: membrane protein insertion efficiency factor YidD [unclassified Mycolicibacterium]|uniref:membrane protein insertion efficiency factor YidD n=1 Tax=unclassified Mycolicibacterium TaxID=2636767 RepID=UPI001F4C421B|nr:membrane protein insertion efficiency factor YidD [Mycolicibacterium sp. YH-1]UNB52820.1 membrane protein insertion efficiency factor YidD [Mycolicibacterium sp. YH-1]